MRSRILGVVIASGALVLSGCGSSGDDASENAAETSPAAPATTEPAPEPAAGPTNEPVAPAQNEPAMPARPAYDECVRIDPAPDGRYQVFDAGEAVVTFTDGRLTLESVTPAEGWTHQVDDQEPDEVEIEFRRDAEQLDLEIEVDDGRVEVKICNDDD